MRYTSTRDSSLNVSFEEAITSGYAPDGGLFVPQELPRITDQDLKRWSDLTFPSLAQRVLRLFVSYEELPDEALMMICRQAYFVGFDDPDFAVPVHKLGSVYLAELFEGPTFCFKDLGMRPVVGLLGEFATKRRLPTTLIVSTTGDTGPAAVQAVSDLDNPYLSILVHYPDGQISNFQRLQLTTIESDCVRIAAFEGGGDDMDLPIKRILTDQQKLAGAGGLEKSTRICGVNSYNIGRPLMQMIHFIWTYLRVMEDMKVTPGASNKLDVVIPTGAMGNMTGGYIAKQMGLPLGKFCAGTNVNDITHRTFQNGTFHKASGEMRQTLSEAINIQLPYNFERLLYYLSGEDSMFVKEWMSVVDETQQNDLNAELLEKLKIEFESARIDDDRMCGVIRDVHRAYDYFLDPHSAVALGAAEELGYFSADNSRSIVLETPVAVMATASPCKFQEAVTAALGEEGWQEYERKEFPSRALDVLEREEVSPAMYKMEDGKALSDAQVEWEMKARALIEVLQAR